MNFNYDEEKFVTFSKIESLWSKNTKPIAVYLNNPFCNNNNCKFCVHRGTPYHTEEEVDWFYFTYMPKQFKRYAKVLKTQNIHHVNYGGGTPNYLSAEKFQKYLDKVVPKCLKKKELPKYIELHVGYLTKEFLKMLADNHFTMVTFCIQTFDKEVLDFEHRKYKSPDEIIELARYAHSLGLKIAVDLIFSWHKNNLNKDKEIYQNDLKILKQLEPEEISTAILYQSSVIRTDEEKQQMMSFVKANLFFNFPSYLQDNENGGLIIRSFKNYESQKLFMDYVYSLTAGTPWLTDKNYSVLGIGTYKSQNVDIHSGIGAYIGYHEVQNAKKPLDPYYYLAKNIDFWEYAHRTLDKIKEWTENKEVPVGTVIKLVNIIPNDNTFFGNVSEQPFLNFEIYSPKQNDEMISTLNKNMKLEDNMKLLKDNSDWNQNVLMED